MNENLLFNELKLNDSSIAACFSYRERIGFGFKRLTDWLKHKSREISFILTDDNLKLALVSPIEEPQEGARYKVGDRIHAVTYTGSCRLFQVCGVQSGGYSNAYTVIDRTQMKAYCLKTSRALYKTDRIQNKKLEREARIWLSLGYHQNLVTAHSVYYIKNRLHILNEYVPGNNLSSQLKSGALPLLTAIKYSIGICRAMTHAKKVFPGFRHGDIKPANCLITKQGVLKLTDFGLSQTGGLIQPSKQSQRGESHFVDEFAGKEEKVVSNQKGGTLHYMAPEMFDSSSLVDERSDIYSFGVTLYEMLIGSKPLVGNLTRENFIEYHKFEEPTFPALECKEIPEGLKNLILSCLTKAPDERPKSFQAIENQLVSIAFDETGETIPSETATTALASENLERAHSFVILKEFEKARNCLEEIGKVKNSANEICGYKAVIYSALNQTDLADTLSKQAVADGWQLSYPVLFSRARVLCALEKHSEALAYIEKVLLANRYSAAAWNLKGEILARMNSIQSARRCFKRAYMLDPHHEEPLTELARLYLLTGEFDKALFYAQKARSLNLGNPQTHKILGDAYNGKNLYLEAVECYKESLILEPDNRLARRMLVRACCRLYRAFNNSINLQTAKIIIRGTRYESRRAEFVEDFINLTSGKKYDPLLLYFLDDAIYIALESANSTLVKSLTNILRQFFADSPKEFVPLNPYYSLGKLFYILEEYDDCLAVFNRSLQEHGAEEKSFYYLGACYEIKGDLELSLLNYNQALQFNDRCELNNSGKRRVTARLKEDRRARRAAAIGGRSTYSEQVSLPLY